MEFPPSSRMGAPTWERRNCGVETMPNFETTIERPCPGTDENCCARDATQERNTTNRHAKRFISPRGFVQTNGEFGKRSSSTLAHSFSGLLFHAAKPRVG